MPTTATSLSTDHLVTLADEMLNGRPLLRTEDQKAAFRDKLSRLSEFPEGRRLWCERIATHHLQMPRVSEIQPSQLRLP